MICWRLHGVLIISEKQSHLCVFSRGKLVHTFNLLLPEHFVKLLCRLNLLSISLLFNPVDVNVNHVALDSLGWLNKHRIWLNTLRRMKGENQITGVYYSEQRLTLITLKETPKLQLWLESIQASKCLVKGCHLLPLEAVTLCMRFKEMQGWVILVSYHQGHIRHSIFNKGHFMMTRWIPVLDPGFGEKKLLELYQATKITTGDYLTKTYNAVEADMHFFIIKHGMLIPHRSLPRSSTYTLQDFSPFLKWKKGMHTVEALIAASFVKRRRPHMYLIVNALAANYHYYRKQTVLQRSILGCAVLFILSAAGWMGKTWLVSTIPNDVRFERFARPKTDPHTLSQPLKLDAIIYRDKQHWAFWVEGKRYTPAKPLLGFTVEDVNARAITGVWCENKICQQVVLGVKGSASTLGVMASAARSSINN